MINEWEEGIGDLWKERKCICRKDVVENGSDVESHGDSCCWQLVYRSVKLKGRSVNQKKRFLGVCRRKAEKGKCLMSLRVGCFFVCLLVFWFFFLCCILSSFFNVLSVFVFLFSVCNCTFLFMVPIYTK